MDKCAFIRNVTAWCFCLALVAEGRYYNSTPACTFGSDRVNHILDCKLSVEPVGNVGIIAIRKIFFGATPVTSGCSRTAPFNQCCGSQVIDDSCVFENDAELKYIAKSCSGHSACNVVGRRQRSSNGGCNQTLYSTYTSFSFVEYECINYGQLTDICKKSSEEKKSDHIYLESNHVHTGVLKQNTTDCSCTFYTQCGENVIFEALAVRLKDIDPNTCAEELYFSDLKNTTFHSTISCHDEYSYYYGDKTVFESSSNAASFEMVHFGNREGNVLLSVTSSNSTSVVEFSCGNDNQEPLVSPSEYYCPGDITVPTTPIRTEEQLSSSTLPPTTAADTTSSAESTKIVVPPAASHSTDDSLQVGTIVGIVLSVIAIILVSLLIVLFICYYRKRKNARNDDVQRVTSSLYDNFSVGSMDTSSYSNAFPSSSFHDYAQFEDPGASYDTVSEGASGGQRPPDPDGDYVDLCAEKDPASAYINPVYDNDEREKAPLPDGPGVYDNVLNNKADENDDDSDATKD